jgi:hypothetical protein
MAETKVTEQIAYAKILDKGMKIGMLILFITFIIYMTGILSPYIPVQELPNYWKLPVHKYLEVTGIHPGWAWLGMLGKGDFLNFIGIAFLSGVTAVCYLRIIPILFRKKDIAFGVIAILEVLVLVLAASGLLKSGGH